ncbi:hypothetical protein [Nodularia chucula]|uniref:hypothetical protein n=1 Tax=Nodularia chucula TaxID=3093667 RepID=UPI0039C70729
MKAIASGNTTFNLKLMAAVAGSISIILYPAIAHAENSDATVNLPESVGGVGSVGSVGGVGGMDGKLLQNLRQLAELKAESQTADLATPPREIPSFQPATGQPLPKGLLQLAELPQESPTVKILTPSTDTIADVPASTVILQFPIGQEIELRVNGVLADESSIGRTETNENTNLVTQTWFGVSLQEGLNTISAQIVGATEPPAIVQVTVRGTPTNQTRKLSPSAPLRLCVRKKSSSSP